MIDAQTAYNEAMAEWLAEEPCAGDFEGECECFEDDLIELRDDRELKLECLRLALSNRSCPDAIEMAGEFFEFVTA